MTATNVTVTSSLAVHLRHLADVIHDLGPQVFGYLIVELAARSTATIDIAERYARLTRHHDFIMANMPARPTAWQVK